MSLVGWPWSRGQAGWLTRGMLQPRVIVIRVGFVEEMSIPLGALIVAGKPGGLFLEADPHLVNQGGRIGPGTCPGAASDLQSFY